MTMDGKTYDYRNTFEIGADADKAALNVNNRVKQAEAFEAKSKTQER